MNLASMDLLSLETVIYLANVAIASVVACGVSLIAIRIWRTASLPLQHAVLVISLVASLASPIFLALPHAGFSPFALTMHSNIVQSPGLEATPRDAPREPFAEFDRPSRSASSTAPQILPKPVTNAPDIEAPLSRPAPSGIVPAIPSPRRSLVLIRFVGNWFVFLWLIGFAWGSWQLAHGCIQLRRLVRGLKPLTNPEIDAATREAALQLGQLRVPPIRQSNSIHAPLSLGLFSPLVVVPTAVAQSLSADQLRGMLLHECAHIHRRDHLVGVLQRLAVLIFWWNPLVLRASERISTIREQICDDLATSRIESPDLYAEMLVDLAERFSVLSLPGAIGIFESSGREFTNRIVRLLNHERSIVTTLDRRMKLISGIALVVMLGTILGTGIQVKSADATAPDDLDLIAPIQLATPDTGGAINRVTTKPENDAETAPPLKWPAALTGTVKNPNGKPLAGARVNLEVQRIHEFSIGRWDETVYTKSLVTGLDGEYRFDTTQLPPLPHRPISITVSVTAEGYADARRWTWYDRRDQTLGEHFRDITMQVGRVVHGRCVDQYGKPIPGAIVKVACDYTGSGEGTWAWNPKAADKGGKFEISLPASSKLAHELWVVHPNWAPQHVVVPKDGNELADIRMHNGAQVKGVVLQADGKPVGGAVVAAESIFDGDLTTVAFPARVAVKTDANGQYELPPLDGIYKVYLAQAAETDARLDDRYLVADGPPPLVLPQRASLSGSLSQTLNFQAGPTLNIRGTIRWPDGKPVTGIEVRATYVPDTAISECVGRTKTDAQGKYSLPLPRPIDALNIDAMGARDKTNKWWYAVGETKVPVVHQGIHFIELKDLKDDVDGLDFAMVDDIQAAVKATR